MYVWEYFTVIGLHNTPARRQLHGKDRILDEQQQTHDECRENTGDKDIDNSFPFEVFSSHKFAGFRQRTLQEGGGIDHGKDLDHMAQRCCDLPVLSLEYPKW